MEKTSLGLDENIEGLLCYVLGWLTGIVFLVLGRRINSFGFTQCSLSQRFYRYQL